MRKNNRSNKICNKFHRKGGFANAKTSTCCAWTQFRVLDKKGILKGEDYCGLSDSEFAKMKKTKGKVLRAKGVNRKDLFRPDCCEDEPKDSFGDCDSMNWPKGPAMIIFLKFGMSNEAFYNGYLYAWKKATENGWDVDPIGVVKSLDPKDAKAADDINNWMPTKKQQSTKTKDVQLKADLEDDENLEEVDDLADVDDVFMQANDIMQEDYDGDDDTIEEQLKSQM